MLIIAPTKGMTLEEKSVYSIASKVVSEKKERKKKRKTGRHWFLNSCYSRVTWKCKSPTDIFSPFSGVFQPSFALDHYACLVTEVPWWQICVNVCLFFVFVNLRPCMTT